MRQIPRFSEFQNTGEAGLRALAGQARSGRSRTSSYSGRSMCRRPALRRLNTHNAWRSARDAIALVVRRLPQPLPGTGAIAEYAELGNFRNAGHDELSAEHSFTTVHGWTCSTAARFCGTISRFRSTANPGNLSGAWGWTAGATRQSAITVLFGELRGESMDLRSYYKRVREADATLTRRTRCHE